MLEDQLVQGWIIPIRDEPFGLVFIERSRFLEQSKKGPAAIVQVVEPVLHFGWAKRVDIETDVFPMLAITVTFEGPDLVEGDTEIGAAKRFVLVKLEAILVVQMKRP